MSFIVFLSKIELYKQLQQCYNLIFNTSETKNTAIVPIK